VFVQWHTIIGEYNLSDSEELNAELRRNILSIYEELRLTGQGSVYPEITHLYRERGFAALDIRPHLPGRLRAFLNSSIAEYLSLVAGRAIEVSEADITSIWPNVNCAGQLHRPHRHDCTQHVLVGTYFVSASPQAGGEGELCLLDPRGIVGGSAEYRRLYNEGEICFAPKPGRLVLFPPHIMHYVAPHQSDESRISLSFNVHAQVLRAAERRTASSSAAPTSN
jgi:uncharacterized protein (TIGR02466 family)